MTGARTERSLVGGDTVLDVCLLQSLHCLHNRKQLRHVVIPEGSVSIRPRLPRPPQPTVPTVLGEAVLDLPGRGSLGASPHVLLTSVWGRFRGGGRAGGRGTGAGAGLTSPAPGHSCTASPPVGRRGQCVSQQDWGGSGVLAGLTQGLLLANAGQVGIRHSPHRALACFQGLQQSRELAGWPQQRPQGACPPALAPAPFQQPTQGLTL